jgi:hypothetical protein
VFCRCIYNDKWYDQECQEIIEAKRKARLKCIQCNTRANQEEYSQKRIAAARVCHRKKRDILKRKVDETVNITLRMKARNSIKESEK